IARRSARAGALGGGRWRAVRRDAAGSRRRPPRRRGLHPAGHERARSGHRGGSQEGSAAARHDRVSDLRARDRARLGAPPHGRLSRHHVFLRVRRRHPGLLRPLSRRAPHSRRHRRHRRAVGGRHRASPDALPRPLVPPLTMLKRLIPLVVLLAFGGGIYWYSNLPITSLTLTGTVTTHEIVVSPQIGGRIEKLLVNEGDMVAKDQLVAVLAPAELQQERA